jgi:hypothetical protein
MNRDIIFVTAFKDIDRKNWKNFRCSNDTYFNHFYRLAKNIKYLLIVYLEPYFINKMKGIKFNNNIIFKNINEVDSFYNKYIELDNKIIDSDEYKSKIPPHRKNNPEHCQYGYNLINHSKICFVKHTKKYYPNYKFYSWIDFGTYNKSVENIPKRLNLNLISEKITYNCLNQIPEKKIDPNIMLKSDMIYFTGGSFIVYFKYVDILYNLMINKIIELHKQNITDDDQNLVLQIYFDRPDLFDIKYSNDWFGLYKDNFNNK